MAALSNVSKSCFTPSFQAAENRNSSWPLSSGKHQFLKVSQSLSVNEKSKAPLYEKQGIPYEKQHWRDTRRYVLNNGLRSLPPKDVLRLHKEEGYVLLDVSPIHEFVEAHIDGSENAQVFRLIQDWTPNLILRRAILGYLGVFKGTEQNEDFLKEVEAAGIKKDTKIIVVCLNGGTTKPSETFTIGKESRSLIAASILFKNGYKIVHHLDGGLRSWRKQKLPLVSSS